MSASMLASPSLASPQSSPSSPEDYDESPQLPALSSPFSMTDLDYRTAAEETPTRAREPATPAAAETPSWLTDELDEEWIEREYELEEGTTDEDETEEEMEDEDEEDMDLDASREDRSFNSHASSNTGSIRLDQRSFSASPSGSVVYASANLPRVPSSLRFGFNASSATSSSQQTDSSPLVDALPPPSSEMEQDGGSPSSVGTFIVREGDSDSYGQQQGESQLQAAVRALRGPSSGLGAPVYSDVKEVVLHVKSAGGVGDRLGGLRRLFDPPSPPTILPSTTVPAPSVDEFTFTPPVTVPRTSWKSIPHFSPTDSTPRAAAPTIPHNPGFDQTPSHPTTLEAPAPKAKERYLHSQSAISSLPLEQPHQTGHVPASAPMLETQVQGPGLKLFEFQYDTLTRDHLAALVDEIDGLGSESGAFGSKEHQAWETSFVDVPKFEDGNNSAEGESDSPGSDGRSSKRIRLSPVERSGRKLRERIERRDVSGSSKAAREALERVKSVRRRTPGTLGRAARWITADKSETESPSRLARLSTSTPSTNVPTPASLPFAHSLDQSALLVLPSPAPTPSSSQLRQSSLSVSPNPQPKTRDRLEEANALLSRIRARTEQKERAKTINAASSTPPEPTVPPSIKTGRRARRLSNEDLNERSILPTPAVTRSRPYNISPRKLLRRLSASDEVDHEEEEDAADDGEHEQHSVFDAQLATSTRRTDSDTEPPLPHLAAAASASLRSALGESRETPRTPTRSSVNGPQPEVTPSSARRHFARTPVSSISVSRRSRERADDLFPLATSNNASSGESEQEDAPLQDDPSTAKLSFATVTPITPLHVRGHSRQGSITTIGPSDVEALLASAGVPSRMVFDREQGRWIKTSRKQASAAGRLERIVHEDEFEDSGSTEDDPFRDFDTTRASEVDLGGVGGLSGLGISAGTPPPRVMVSPPDANHFALQPRDADEEPDDEEPEDTALWTGFNGGQAVTHPFHEETETLSDNPTPTVTATITQTEESPFHLFQTLQSAANGYPLPTIVTPTESTEDVASSSTTLLPNTISQPLQITIETFSDSPPFAARPSLESAPLPPSPRPPVVLASIPTTPRPPPPPTLAPSTPVPRSTVQVAPPRSALKGTTRSHSAPGLTTPVQQISEPKPPRSVSFSDGKLHGPIEGLRLRDVEDDEKLVESPIPGSRLKFEVTAGIGTFMGAEAFGEPGSLEIDEPHPELGELSVTPESNASKFDRALRELQVAGLERSHERSRSDTSIVIGSFESAPKLRPKGSRSTTTSGSRTFRRTTSLDATLMTECSFGVSRDRLVQYITDVEPFEPDWEGLRSISLANKAAESMVRLKDFLPNLDELDLCNNELGFLTGIPSTVRTLLLATNKISSLTSFGHLRNLERVDISNNQVDSVNQLSCLVHLRELKADNNRISDLGGLATNDGLIRLSLKGNQIQTLDFAATQWTRLETLNLCRNKLTSLRHLESLPALTLLNLDHNSLCELRLTSQMPKLRVLRLCSNPISSLNVAFAPKLRTLFIDGSQLGVLDGTNRLRKLENLSVRDQKGGALTLPMHDIRDVKRLYLSGNPVPTSFPSEKFFNLVYLELAMCGLVSLPPNLAMVIPNVRHLNLNFNFVEDLEPLRGLTRLQKLSVVGARLNKYRPVAELLSTMLELECVDLRMNPLTLAFYPPLVLQGDETLPPHADYRIIHPVDDGPESRSRQWSAIDHRFRKALPDSFYLKRMTYRALVLQAVPTLEYLDGVYCSTREREKLAAALSKVVAAKGSSKTRVAEV